MDRALRLQLCLSISIFFGCLAGCKDSGKVDMDGLPTFPYPDGGLADRSLQLHGDTALRDGALVDHESPDVVVVPDVPADAAAADLGASPPTFYDGAPDIASLDGGACASSCDDHDPCTSDSCDPQSGLCMNLPMDEGSPCLNACVSGGQGRCTLGICKGSPVPDGQSCDDHNPCTENDSCKGGQCFSGPSRACPAIDICHEAGYCDRSTGQCTTPVASDNKACDDGQRCTIGDQCRAGQCVGVSLACTLGATCGTDGACAAGSRISFPSGTVAVSLPKVTLAANNLGQDQEGSFYVVGSISSATDLGGGMLVPAGGGGDGSVNVTSDVVLGKLDAAGKLTWGKLFGDSYNQLGEALAVNRKGQIIVTGQYNGSIAAGTTTITNPRADLSEGFILAVDATSGTALWAVRPQVSGAGLSVQADPVSGDFVVCTRAETTGAVGLVAGAPAADDGDIVVARLKANDGSVVWSRQISAPGAQSCDGVALDHAGHVFIAGGTSSINASGDAGVSDIDLGNGVHLTTPPARPSATVVVAWVASLDAADGKTLGATSFSGPTSNATQKVHQINCDPSGNVLIAGSIKNSGAIGPITLAGTPTYANALVAKLSPQLQPLWAHTWPASGTGEASFVAHEPSGSVIVAGFYTSDFAVDGLAMPRGPNGSHETFIARLDDQSGKAAVVRGYGGAQALQTPLGMVVADNDTDAGAIWLTGSFTGLLQFGPPAASLSAGGTGSNSNGFLARIAP